jgi:hypothetical protein
MRGSKTISANVFPAFLTGVYMLRLYEHSSSRRAVSSLSPSLDCRQLLPLLADCAAYCSLNCSLLQDELPLDLNEVVCLC